MRILQALILALQGLSTTTMTKLLDNKAAEEPDTEGPDLDTKERADSGRAVRECGPDDTSPQERERRGGTGFEQRQNIVACDALLPVMLEGEMPAASDKMHAMDVVDGSRRLGSGDPFVSKGGVHMEADMSEGAVTGARAAAAARGGGKGDGVITKDEAGGKEDVKAGEEAGERMPRAYVHKLKAVALATPEAGPVAGVDVGSGGMNGEVCLVVHMTHACERAQGHNEVAKDGGAGKDEAQDGGAGKDEAPTGAAEEAEDKGRGLQIEADCADKSNFEVQSAGEAQTTGGMGEGNHADKPLSRAEAVERGICLTALHAICNISVCADGRKWLASLPSVRSLPLPPAFACVRDRAS